MTRDEFQAELDRIDRQLRGDPLTPEDEARIRGQERRWAAEARIRREERGFPYDPPWVLPAFGFLAGAMMVAIIALFIVSFR
jgi:hypothetical protein